MSPSQQKEQIQIFLPKPHSLVHTQTTQEASSPYVGLFNHGNTCYLNSLIQTLFMTPIFRHWVFKWKYDSNTQPSKPDCIPYQLQKLFARLQLQKRKVEDTTNLTKSFQWNTNEISEQNDIQELLHLLFEAINEKFINDIFEGEMSSVIKCCECGSLSSRKEKFIDLALPVKNNKHLLDSLQKSIDFLFSIEKLTGDNKYQCDKCDKKVDAEKYNTIDSLPKILICALNRFEYDFNFDCKKKINSKFTFPFEIKTEEVFHNQNLEKRTYFLYSIIVHSGSARGGHYYTITKSIDEDKWYKFDDSIVTQVEINSILDVLYGDNYSDKNAYILLYSNGKEKYTFDIDQELIKEIDQEEVEFQKLLEEEKERMSYINVKVSYNDKIEYVKIKKYQKVHELKLKAIEVFKITEKEADIRIRVMNSNNSKVIDVLSNEEITLEEANVNGSKIYNIEVKDPNGSFSVFNPNDIILNVVIWKDEFTQSKNIAKDIDSAVTRITIDKTLPYEKFESIIREKFSISEGELLITKKQDYGVNNFRMIDLSEKTENFFTEDMKIFVEKKDTESKFKKLFESQIPNIKVIFNFPIDASKLKGKKITVKSYQFNNSIEISPKKTMRELKTEISGIINVPLDNFIMKKNSHNGVEIKKIDDLIEKYTSKTLTLYIQYGTPVKETDIKINLQQYVLDYENFQLFPYKQVDFGLTTISKNWSIKELKEYIETKIPKYIKCQEGEKLYIRGENNFKPGNFYDDETIISSSDIKENSILVCQNIKVENIIDFSAHCDKKNLTQFIVRTWNQSEWKISEPYEIIIDKTITVEKFSQEVLSKIFKGISLNNLYGVKIYHNEMYYCMDDVDKMEFYSFADFCSSTMQHFPFLITNIGCLLLIKDISNPYREPTEEEKEYFFKKVEKKTVIKKIFVPKRDPFGCTTKSHVKKERYKEKAMVITVKGKEPSENESAKEQPNSPDEVLSKTSTSSANNNEREEIVLKHNEIQI